MRTARTSPAPLAWAWRGGARPAPALAVTLALAATLAACGGSDGAGGASAAGPPPAPGPAATVPDDVGTSGDLLIGFLKSMLAAAPDDEGSEPWGMSEATKSPPGDEDSEPAPTS